MKAWKPDEMFRYSVKRFEVVSWLPLSADLTPNPDAWIYIYLHRELNQNTEHSLGYCFEEHLLSDRPAHLVCTEARKLKYVGIDRVADINKSTFTSSPPTNSPPAASPSTPHEMTAEGEGPTTTTTDEDQPVVAEIHSIWDLPEDGPPASTPVLPTSPDLFLDDVDNGDIPQPGWHARTPGTPGTLPPSPPRDQEVSGVNQEGDSLGDEANQDEEEAVTRAEFTARWREAFRRCHRGNLDQTMEEFTRELLHTANRLLARPPVDRNNSV
ncbi:hypothetical protein EGW08_013638 [Elysia chlorotica]|uniref:Uncharacterized protein n=1 Tax=Elysia chlorotica TaxID=188477 RepID=A0A3S1B9W8_ELYCH|nr:hypothetical protein EGW08_013638 [Elysia chlorotica]